MKLDSPWFDRIRTSSKEERIAKKLEPAPCEWAGCGCAGGFRAPKGRQREGQYHNFCYAHAREYNQSYNYFANMPDDAVAAWQKASIIGHRPTWTMGQNAAASRQSAKPRTDSPPRHDWDIRDPFGFMGTRGGAQSQSEPDKPVLRNAERTALEALGFEGHAPAAEIKARFKSLVKRLHPDANGGDRGSEDKLRAVIQAYNYLKQAGFC